MQRLRDDERGVATVMVVMTIPVLLLFCAFVVNVGRWWVVDRHMQTQADAAALAAGTELANDPLHCTAARIQDRAKQYAGISTTVAGESAAAQFNTPGDVNTPSSDYDGNFRFNSASYASGDSDPDAAGFTGAKADPCVSGIADIKLTTSKVPALLQAIGVTPDVDAHARVALLKAGTPANAAPFGVETSDPKRVYAEFVDLSDGATNPAPVPVYTSTGAQVNGFDLQKTGISGGLATWSIPSGYTLRSSSAGRLGLRLRLSDSAGTVSCSDSSLVACYGYGQVGTQQNSLTAVRVYSDPDASGASGVRAGVVTVIPSSAAGACDPAMNETGYFHTSCTAVSVTAHLRGLSPADTPVVKVNGATLTYDAGSGPAGDATWTGDVPVTAASGANELTITWSQASGTVSKSGGGTTACTKKSPCSGTIANVHRTFAGSFANAGVVKHLDVAIGTGAGSLLDNVKAGTCTSSSPCALSVAASLGGSITLAKASDPAIALRLGDSGSLTGLLDCDPNTTQADQEILTGCGANRYVQNTGQDCSKYLNANQLFGDTAALPWPCVGSEQGNKIPKVPGGLTARILCAPYVSDPSTCLTTTTNDCKSKNHWPDFTPDDPRIIPMFLVRTGASAASGSSVYPILGFAAFYVTGWTGSPCTGSDNEIPAAYKNDKASVFGHWINYIAPALDSPDNTPCDLSSVQICTPVLVK